MPTTVSSKSRSPLDTRSTLPALREFLLHLASERGLADNTLLGYRRDLEDIQDAFERRGLTLTTADADAFRDYLRNQTRKGQSTRTVARRLAAIRVFLRYLAAQGYDVVPVPVYYPEALEILGRPVYRRVQDVPDGVDLVDVFRRPQDIPPHVEDLIAARPKAIWFQLGIRNDAAARQLAEAGIRVVQDRCTLVEHRRLLGHPVR